MRSKMKRFFVELYCFELFLLWGMLFLGAMEMFGLTLLPERIILIIIGCSILIFIAGTVLGLFLWWENLKYYIRNLMNLPSPNVAATEQPGKEK